MSRLETPIQKDIRLALGQQDDFVIWRNSRGVAVYEKKSRKTGRKRKYTVPYGLVDGASDLIGILKPHGRFCAFEVKRPGREPTEEQLMFLQLVRIMGGFATHVTGVKEALAALERARAGEYQ
jgi:hypothetical protein